MKSVNGNSTTKLRFLFFFFFLNRQLTCIVSVDSWAKVFKRVWRSQFSLESLKSRTMTNPRNPLVYLWQLFTLRACLHWKNFCNICPMIFFYSNDVHTHITFRIMRFLWKRTFNISYGEDSIFSVIRFCFALLKFPCKRHDFLLKLVIFLGGYFHLRELR